jgi:nucleoside-diphosphate-sugar epimerase
MKVFLVGATGVVGQRAVDRLVAAGHDVSGLARSDAKADQLRAQGAVPVQVDLFDADAVRRATASHDAIVNLATHIPPASKSARRKAWAENDRIRTEGSRILADAAIANGARRYVQESIAFLYADQGDRWITEDGPRMDSPFTPAVDAAEANDARVTEHGGAGVVLRFGMFVAPDSGHIVDVMKFARWGWFAIPGPADAYQSNIHADDAADAVLAALGVAPGVYNVVDDEPVTRAELAAVLAPTVGRRRLRLLPRWVSKLAAARVPNLVVSQRVSNERFKAASGWTPAHPTMREGAAELASQIAGSAS